MENQQTEAESCFSDILNLQIPDRQETVGQTVIEVADAIVENRTVAIRDGQRALETVGLRIGEEGENRFLFISNQNKALKSLMERGESYGDYHKILMRHPDYIRSRTMRINNVVTRGKIIKLNIPDLTIERKAPLNEEERIMSALKSSLEKARKEGMKKGMEKGIEKGMKKGMKKGIEKGIEKGMKKGMKKGIEKGIEKGMKKGMKKGIEKGIEKGMKKGMKKGMAKGIEKGMKKGMKKGIEKGMEKGIEKGMKKGMKKGIEKGMEKGIKKGIERGMKKGMEKGVKKGRLEALKQIALKMLEKGENLHTIKKWTGLPQREIEKLKV